MGARPKRASLCCPWVRNLCDADEANQDLLRGVTANEWPDSGRAESDSLADSLRQRLQHLLVPQKDSLDRRKFRFYAREAFIYMSKTFLDPAELAHELGLIVYQQGHRLLEHTAVARPPSGSLRHGYV